MKVLNCPACDLNRKSSVMQERKKGFFVCPNCGYKCNKVSLEAYWEKKKAEKLK